MVFKEILIKWIDLFQIRHFSKKQFKTFQTEGKLNQKCVPIFLNIFTFNHKKMEKNQLKKVQKLKTKQIFLIELGFFIVQ